MSQHPASTRLVPAERLSAITSLIAEGAVFDGNFHTSRDQGIKVDGLLKGNITLKPAAHCMWAPQGSLRTPALRPTMCSSRAR